MTRSKSAHRRDGMSPVGRHAETVRGLGAGLLVLAIAVGVPVALVLGVGNPIPHLPPGSLGNQVPIDVV
ncbi:MAG TPA: hypothetical protein VEL73_08805, partial [Mycobacteriales bacterium]|nr:hypothetical protein [Mycobacteriales bacterium]